MQKTFVASLAFSFILVLSVQNCEANKREMLKKVFGFLDFDARDVKEPTAFAPRAPVVIVPQYRSTNPIYLQPLSNPVPEVSCVNCIFLRLKLARSFFIR